MITDEQFKEDSTRSGKAYGYPQCCIDEFVSEPPSWFEKNKPTKLDRLRFRMSHINGKYTGFIPCSKHAQDIAAGKIKLSDLIEKQNRTVFMPFPNDWSMS